MTYIYICVCMCKNLRTVIIMHKSFIENTIFGFDDSKEKHNLNEKYNNYGVALEDQLYMNIYVLYICMNVVSY